MKNLYLVLIIIATNVILAIGQNGTQTIKGNVLDKQSEIPLIGATVYILAENIMQSDITDIDGHFKIEGVKLGRQAIQLNYLGYEPVTIPNIEVKAGKEVFINVEMTESLNKLDEVVITAETAKDRSINDMATVSSRQFSMEEVNRYSGGRSDVARLAGNFAGVSTADDSRNDIVIRGNSPTGLLWRLEGIPIPSPNHFSTIGTTGGPVSALNTNLLKNSDFMTSAFPAEYGNALSGVFDLGFRNGNKDKIEYTFQLGATTGIEAMIEGPISKKNNSSFLVAYRYSFVGVAQAAGLNIGTNAVPTYQDLSFKLDMGRSPLGRFTIFGIGGRSDIEFLKDEIDATDLFSADDEDARADSRFNVIGLKHNILLSEDSYIRTLVAYSKSGTEFSRDRYYNLGQPEEKVATFAKSDDALSRISASSFYNKKFNSKVTMRLGALVEELQTDLDFSSAEYGIDANNDGIFDLQQVYKSVEKTYLAQPYIQAQYRLNSNLTLNAGLHGLYYTLNGQATIEPRAALNWHATANHRFNIGYGLHNQTQPLPLQLASTTLEGGESVQPNMDLGFSKSHQYVVSHDYKINDSWRSKVEVYYQDISNVPVDKYASTFSVLNVGADFGFPIDKNNLINVGTGTNKGVELTLEKFFTGGNYMLFTGSWFDSKYTGSDGIERNTAFNNRYVINLLGGTEFEVGKQKQHRFTMDTKLTRAGGRYYTPVDLEASKIDEIEIFDESKAFSLKYNEYFRLDLKFGLKMNNSKRKLSQSFYIDIQNVMGAKNIFRKSYNRLTNEVNDIYQIGFFPNFLYKIEF